MIKGILQSTSMPALEKMVQFTGARNALLAHNIANLSTPHFRPRDIDPKAFQAQLGRALQDRRVRADRGSGTEPLRLKTTRQIREGAMGLDIRPEHMDRNILFHDRNNSDLERTMQDLAENTMAHSASLTFLKSEMDIIQMAIRGRV